MSKNRFDILFESVPTPVLIWHFRDGGFYLDAYNRAADRGWHEGLEMWKHKPAHDLFKNQKGITGALRACLDFRRPIATEGWYRFDFSLETRYYTFQYTYLEDDYVIMYMEDITRQVEFEEEVQLYFQTSIDMLCIMDWKGFFKKLSVTWGMTLGWSDDELRERPVIEFIHEEDRKEAMDAFEALKNGDVVIGFTNRFLCKDQTYKWLEWNSSVNLERKMIISAARDVTLQKEAERMLKESIQAQESANNAKSEFLANMSHEIRTPLNAVIGFSELLKTQLVEPQLKSYVESINTAGRNLLELINDILDLSKLEAGMLAIHHESMSLSRCFQEIEIILSQKIQEKKITYDFEMAPEVPDMILFDEVRIKQIFMNLLGNAIKFTDEGKIHVRIQKKETIEPVNSVVTLVITVEDTGIGIHEAELESIFEAFRQSGEPKQKKGGTGLGLTISQKLVQLLGGTIDVASNIGQGTTFTVEFKHVEVHGVESEHVEPESVSTDILFEDSEVLVVDDDFINRYLIREVLTPRKVNVKEASNGQEVLQIIETVNFDLILMDIRLPDMNGSEIASKIRQSGKNKKVPIIALTASTAFENDDYQMRKVFDDIITKPVSIDELLRTLAGYLKHHQISKVNDVHPVKVDERSVLESLKKIEKQDLVEWAGFIEELTGAIRLNLIHALIEELQAYDQAYDVEAMNHWAMRLQKYTESFEVDKINALLEEMLNLVKKSL